MGGRQHGHAVGADLVGRVAVGGDAVGARDDGLHPPLPHHLGGHAVADQRHVDPPLLQFPGGQPGALQQRPGFVGVDVERLARLGGGEEHGQRRAVVGSGQSAGVAVGQHALPVAQAVRPRGGRSRGTSADLLRGSPGPRPAARPRFRPSAGREADGGSFHPLQGPEQVDGRRAAGGQIVGRFVQPLKERRLIASGDILHAETQAVRRGDADGRRAADAQRFDGFPHRLHVAAFDFDELDRQPRLVDHSQAAVDAADPMERLEVLHSW